MMLAAAPNDEEQKLDSKTMQGVGSYRVLDNPLYMQSFSYLAPKVKDGKIMHPSFKHVPIENEDGNLRHDRDQDGVPYMVVNTAFLRENLWEKINFETCDNCCL